MRQGEWDTVGAMPERGIGEGRTYLVAREAEDDKALILVLLVESLEALVLGCEAAARESERK